MISIEKQRTLILVLEKTFPGNSFFLARTFLQVLCIFAFLVIERFVSIRIGGDENQLYRPYEFHRDTTP